MITTTPTGWTKTGDSVRGRHYAEDATNITAVYRFDFGNKVVFGTVHDRVLCMSDNGSPPSDADRDRVLTAFDMVGAAEMGGTDSDRVFRMAGL